MSKRLFEDTDEKTEGVLIEINRSMPDWKKCQQIFSLIEMGRQLALTGLKMRYPNADEEELKKRYAALVLDKETVIKAYGWNPDIEGY
jgi:hypothetical protein